MYQRPDNRPTSAAATTDATLSFLLANVLGCACLPLGILLFVVPYALLWSVASLQGALESVFSLPRFIPAFFLSVVLHEALHAVGFVLFGRAPWSAVQVGVKWRLLTPFAHCRVPLSAPAYRRAIVLPGLVLGVIPAALGVALGSGVLAVWGTLMFVTAGGDFAALWAARAVPAGARVLDHPEKVGCLVLPD